MKFNAVPGVIYDAIIYNIIYFCQDAMFKNIRLYTDNDNDVFFYYNDFRKSKTTISPPDDFYPFFFFQNQGPCVLTEYFTKNFNCFTGTVRDFLNLFHDKKMFKRHVVFYYLDEYSDRIDINEVLDGNPVMISRALVLLRDHGTYMDSFVRVFYDFDVLIDELVKYIQALIRKLEKFHDKYKDVVSTAIDKFIDSKTVKVFTKKAAIDKSIKIADQIFSGCLLHPTVLKWQVKNNNYSFIISPYAYKSVLLYTQFKNINEYSLPKLFANEITCDIIKELTKEELTVTKLSLRLHVSRTTVDRLIAFLRNELAINVSRSDGNEKYYKINPEYFAAAKNSFDKMYQKLMERWL